jgi:hypothetical protein
MTARAECAQSSEHKAGKMERILIGLLTKAIAGD